MKNILRRIWRKPALLHSLYFTLLLLLISVHAFAQPDTWKKMQSLPPGESASPRILPFTFSIGGKGYMGGGFERRSSLGDFWEYDPVTGAWTQKAYFGGGERVSATGFSIGSKGYAGLGTHWWLDERTPVPGDIPKSDFWEYDPANNEWIQKADFGGGTRKNAVGFSIGSKGYIGCGGSGQIDYNNEDYDYYIEKMDFWEYNPATDTWTQKKDFGGGPRSWASGFSIGDKGYIGLGSVEVGDSKKDFWEYDPATDAWLQKADFGGVARRGAAAFTIGSKGYFGAGIVDSIPSWGGFVQVYKKDFWEYNPATNTWTGKADLTGAARAGAMVFSIAGKGYVAYGENKGQSVYYLPNAGDAINDFWEYDPAINSWTDKTHSEGGARAFAAAFSIGSKGYIGTGKGEFGYKKDFWEFDPMTNSWSQKANFGGTAREGATAFSIGAKGYFGAGQDSVGEQEDFWEYDPAKNAWTQKANLGGGPRSNSKGFSIGNKGYISGYDIGVWEYDPDADSWTKIATDGRSTPAAFSIGNKGYFGSVGVSEFWEFDPQTRTWMQKADFEENPDPDEGTTGVTGFGIGNKGYIWAGKAKFYPPGFFARWTVFKEYDPQTNTWLPKASVGGRRNATGFNIGDKGYLAFGEGEEYGLLIDLWEYTPDTTNTITTVVIDPDHVCSGAPVEIRLRYTTTGHFAADNVFIAQLSNASGSFDNPVSLGTISSNAGSGNIYVTIPADMPSGNGYRIRVVSTLPAVIGSDNNVSFSIDPSPMVTYYRDVDGDGFGDPNSLISAAACTPPTGYVTDSTDCNDNNNAVHEPVTYYRDVDGDGFGDPDHSISACSDTPPAGYVKNNLDCDDEGSVSDSMAIVTVPGTSNSWLAGMPDGTQSTFGDVAPANSPVLAPVKLTGGSWIEIIRATGAVAHGGGYPTIGPEGCLSEAQCQFWQYIVDHQEPHHGKSSLWAPINSLVAVFLNDGIPTDQFPQALDFSTESSRNFLNLYPQLQQVFFIGDGRTDQGTVQKIFIPTGATRLYLGTMDGAEWNNNIGTFCVALAVRCNSSITYWYKDADGDGYGNPTCRIKASTQPAGYVADNTDCNDYNKAVHAPVTWYRDSDHDGFGDSYNPISVCSAVPPAGYVKNNYDCYDHERASDPGYVRIRMCHDGWTQCVYAKDTAEKISLGWSLGICPLQSCAADETLMCHNGKQECVKTTDAAAKLAEAGGKWSLGPYCSGVPISGSGSGSVRKIDMARTEKSMPSQYSLSNHPNPFVGTSTIKYELPFDSKVSIKVYDLAGRTVATLVDEYKRAGTYTVNFNARNLSSGSLFYKIIARSKEGQFERTNQMVKIK